MYQVIKDNKFTGLGYSQLTDEIIDHHNQYGEYLCKPKRVVAEGELATIEDKKDALWTYAKRYQLSKIDDGGLGVVLNANLAAMLQTKPHQKCEDIIAWSRALWFTDYEARIAAVEAGGAVDLDFSCHGELPWRVVEAVNETEGGAV